MSRRILRRKTRLLKFGEWCLFDPWTGGRVASPFIEVLIAFQNAYFEDFPPVKIVSAALLKFYSIHPSPSSFLKMAYPSDICLDLNLGNDTGAPRQGDIWRPSFLSSNGPLTIEDSVMMDVTTATVVARNLLTPKDNRLLSGRSDESAVRDSLALSIQCASSVSNMGQRLLARSRQVESLMAEVATLSHEIRQLKRENRELHVLANNYSAGMKRKLDQLLDSEGRIHRDSQKFTDVFWRHFLPSSSGVRPSIEALNNPSSVPSVPPSAGGPPSTEASSIEASHK